MGTAMLRELAIRNLAVVEEARVVFGPGLNVLTGETGAGKSIVIDALLLVRGARAQPDLIRTGADSASVEAVFEIPSTSPLVAALEESGHPAPDGQLIVKRELSRSGRHRVFVNDSAATVGLLERLGDLLVELHGQHEHQRLMEPARQLEVLDRFVEAEAASDALGQLWTRWDAARTALVKLRDEAREGARKEERYRWELSDIDAVQLREGEEDELRAERRRLQNAERIFAGLQEAMALLHEDGQAVTSRLARVGALLRDLARFDPDAATPLEALDGAQAYVEDAVPRGDRGRPRPTGAPRGHRGGDGAGGGGQRHGGGARRPRALGGEGGGREEARASDPARTPCSGDGPCALSGAPSSRPGGGRRPVDGRWQLAHRSPGSGDGRVSALRQSRRGPEAPGQSRVGR